MAYTKVGPFVNGGAPALNATNLNIIDNGIYNAHYPWLAAKSATAAVADYPLGISWMSISDASWPQSKGYVMTTKQNATTAIQIFYGYPDSGDRVICWRQWISASSSWLAWQSMGGISGLSASKVVVSDANGKAISSAITVTELGYLQGVTSAIQTQIDSKMNKVTLTGNRAIISDASGVLSASGVTSTELGYLKGVQSAIQTQLNSKQSSITGAATTVLSSNLTANRVLISNASGKIANSTVTSTELGYLAGVQSAIQTQIDNKLTKPTLTVSRALVSDASGNITASGVTSTELSYLSGVTSSIQTQLNSKMTTPTLTASRVLASDGNGNITASSVTDTELSYLSGARSNLQSQIDGISFNVTGGASTIITNNLTANRALVSNGTGKVAVSAVTNTELGYLSGVTSNVQTQLNNKMNNVSLANSRVLVSSDTGSITNSTVTSSELNYLSGVTSNIQTQLDNKMNNVSLTSGKVLVSNDTGGITNSAVSSAELNYLSGARSNIQTQLDNKAPLSSAERTIVFTSNVPVADWTSSPFKVISARTLTQIHAVCNTAPSTAKTIRINRNGTQIATFTINSTNITPVNTNIALNANDIITLSYTGEPYGMTGMSVQLKTV